jgi:hypothetical protein
MSRADKLWALEIPVGNPFGGPAYGLREDPGTLAIMAAVSAGVSAVSSIQQGNAAKAAADFNATISMQNAEIARSDAAAQATQIERENAMRLGAIRTAQGKSGGAADTGSVLDVLGDQAAQGELEKQFAIYQGEQRARGFVNTANLDTASGKAAQKAGYMKAGAELLGGGAKSYDIYNRGTTLKRTGGISVSSYDDPGY